MKLHELKEEFDRVIKKYKFDEPKKAEELAKYLTSGVQLNGKDFSEKFGTTQAEADMFIAFIIKGIEYKEQNIDPHAQN